MKKILIWVIGILLAAVAVFTSLRYSYLINQNKGLRDELRASKFYAENIEERLRRQKKLYEGILEDMAVLEVRLREKDIELETTLKELVELDTKIAVFKQENASLRQDLNLTKGERDKLQAQLERTCQEKAKLEQKFSSLEGLKQAIIDLKIRMRQAKRTRLEKIKYLNSDLTSGNRGYLILNGKSTFSPKVRIKVSPIP